MRILSVPLIVTLVTAPWSGFVDASAGSTAQEVFPTTATAGVPPGWTPKRTVDRDYFVREAGAVVEDLRINGSLIIDAPNVTVRRVEIIGGRIENFPAGTCRNGLVIEDSVIRRGSFTETADPPAIGSGGYTARGVLIDGVPEGFRVSGVGDCGPVVIEDSYSRVVAPDSCGDWHGDSLQGYFGDALTVRNSVLELVTRPDCYGTSPFFYPDQDNTSVDIDGLIVIGGGFSFRLGEAGAVRNLNIVRDSWDFGPIDVKCELVTTWEAWIVSLDGAGQPTAAHPQECDFAL